MRKLLVTGLIAGILLTNSSFAQQRDTTLGQKIGHTTKKVGKAIGKGAKAVGNKTAELASKGSSAVIDKVYEGKVTAAGKTVYINDQSKYYWVDKKGRRHFVKESQLKPKM